MEGLILQGITAGYGDQEVLHKVDLEVAPKTVLVLMGLSGSGKTTLLKTIMGIMRPHTGSIILAGRTITNVPIEERNIGYLPQNYGLFPHLSVAENISYGLRIRGISKGEQKKVVDHLLALIELSGYEDKGVHELSGGQQQRVALARSLAVKPDLLLLDEALSNIDQVTKFDVAASLKKLFNTLNIPIILVTHQYEDAKFFGSRVAVMMDGVIEQIGSYAELIEHPKTSTIKKLLVPFSDNRSECLLN